MAELNAAARELLTSRKLAHCATVSPDGTPQVSVIWVGLDGDTREANGMQHSLLIHGTARVTEGGAAQLLFDLGKVYVGPGAEFRPSTDPDAGFIVHLSVDKLGGIGPWNPHSS